MNFDFGVRPVSMRAFFVRRVFWAGIALVWALCLGCAPARLRTAELVIERAAGAGRVSVTAELARTNEERERGLMNRKRVADGEGMLFIFDRDELVSFWMQNTYVPLSIAFISSDGRITEIRDMRPLDETSVRSNYSVRYALEVPQGWFSSAGVKPGDLVLLDGVLD